MKFFIDTANIAEIEEANSWGAIAGVTTNPTLYARIGGKLADFQAHIVRICQIVDGPVSAEAVGTSRDDIYSEGKQLASLAPNVVVKVPTTIEGLAATRRLANDGISVNMTLCFTIPQAILAARAGARYISPFVGRFDDIGEDGIVQLGGVIEALAGYDFAPESTDGVDSENKEVEVIAASIRSTNHVAQAALLGADIATVPFTILKKCVEHPLTTNGLAAFAKDWEKVQKA